MCWLHFVNYLMKLAGMNNNSLVTFVVLMGSPFNNLLFIWLYAIRVMSIYGGEGGAIGVVWLRFICWGRWI